jgi:hypothetical protein
MLEQESSKEAFEIPQYTDNDGDEQKNNVISMLVDQSDILFSDLEEYRG